ncbi:DUF2778 domain-containing protein [Methylobacterium segetis]|uniref:DUF2778 domain-containing protein n=1 Tax=Methylobacterium segetis TaxID=2488750 RepID=UPI001A9E370F|nr:DUF2778 domain-containing protein [Methylobacterium segetis]
MVQVAYPPRCLAERVHRRRRLRRFLGLALGGAGVAAAIGGVLPPAARLAGPMPAPSPAPDAGAPASPAPLARSAVAATAAETAWMLDPTPLPGRAAGFILARAESAAPRPLETPVPASAPDVLPMAEPQRLAQAVPLPVPRPPEFRSPVAVPARVAARPPQPTTRSVFSAATAAERPFFERFLGKGDEPAGPALAYAAPQSDAIDDSPRSRLTPIPAPAGAGTAIYDISAARVTLPSGEVLEAHSGLGPSLDNPRHVHLRMRGSTPPGTYDLTERERLFHGVRAIRLNPVGGSTAIHGRDGLLAHTYMLGPSGASNGCVVFRQYDRFLQAYLRGEVRRLVVVAGSRQDGPGPGGASRIGLWDRLTGRAGG